jgi:hypothetical protein
MIKRRRYLSYPLRLWRTGDGERSLWRALLKRGHTGEQVGFASPEDLFRFLQTRTGMTPGTDADRHEP